MKKIVALLFAFAVVSPAYAQEPAADQPADAPAADAASTDSAAPADASVPADSGSADSSAASSDSGSSGSDSSASDASGSGSSDTSASSDSGSGSSGSDSNGSFSDSGSGSGSSDSPLSSGGDAPSAVTESTPGHYYFGAEYGAMTLSASAPALQAKLGGSDFGSKMVLLRAGWRVFDAIALELQAGSHAQGGVGAGTAEVSNYFGAFIVPTGNLFDVVEISAPIGFNTFSLAHGNGKQKFQRITYGLNLEAPLRDFGASLPDLRLTGGYRIYYAENDARVYGWHAGVRFDFQL